jgi:hypothetical protein
MEGSYQDVYRPGPEEKFFWLDIPVAGRYIMETDIVERGCA